MSNRGRIPRDHRQPAPRPGPPDGHPSSPRWRIPAEWTSTTVPQSYPADAPFYRQPPRPPRPSGRGASTQRMPSPVRRERLPGGTALDQLDTEESAGGFSWRDLFWRISRMDFGPGKGSAYERELRDHIRTPVGSAFPIAVLNLKGGVGKTAVVEALGSTFADVRNDRVIAVDIDGEDLS